MTAGAVASVASAGGTKSPESAERVTVSAESPATDCERRERGVDSFSSRSSPVFSPDGPEGGAQPTSLDFLALARIDCARRFAPGLRAGLHREERTTRNSSPTRARGATERLSRPTEAVKAEDIFGFFPGHRGTGLWERVRTAVKTRDLGGTEFRAMQRRRRSRSLVACRCPAKRY